MESCHERRDENALVENAATVISLLRSTRLNSRVTFSRTRAHARALLYYKEERQNIAQLYSVTNFKESSLY